MSSDDGHGHGHGHFAAGGADSDRRWLLAALVLLVAFMLGEVAVGLASGSLALLSDAAHMLTDAASIVLALVAIKLAARPARGRYTYGFRRVEILSAQANGITLVLLGLWFVYEGIARLISPPPVQGAAVLITGLVGIAVNIAATWCISKANRSSLNVEGAFQHILNDLYSFIATTLAGLVVLLTGFARADAIAALIVAALMLRAGWGLLRAAGRVFLEAAPSNSDPDRIGAELAGIEGVLEVHDLHLWEITPSEPALSAHVLVVDGGDCHEVAERARTLLHEGYELEHTTLQVDHADSSRTHDQYCRQPHGVIHRRDGSTDSGTVPEERNSNHDHDHDRSH